MEFVAEKRSAKVAQYRCSKTAGLLDLPRDINDLPSTSFRGLGLASSACSNSSRGESSRKPNMMLSDLMSRCSRVSIYAGN